jgi:hypothetical protein
MKKDNLISNTHQMQKPKNDNRSFEIIELNENEPIVFQSGMKRQKISGRTANYYGSNKHGDNKEKLKNKIMLIIPRY